MSFERGEPPRLRDANDANGNWSRVADRAFKGRRAAKAEYWGGGANGYARGNLRVRWSEGMTVSYSAAFYLEPGFNDSVQGPVSLLRWDNWPSDHVSGDIGGLILLGKDRRVHLIRGGYGRGYEGDLIGGIRLPEGRWVRLTVQQRLAGDADGISRVLVDGRPVATVRGPNMSGRTIERLRFGIVSIAAGRQTDPLTLYVDDVRVNGAARIG